MIALLRRRDRVSRLRATRIYLLVILIFTLALFCFSLVSFLEQRKRVNELSSKNFLLKGERLAGDLERRINLLAGDCLGKAPEWQFLRVEPRKQSSKDLRHIREQFSAIKEIYPFAQHFFVFSKHALVFPRISSLPRLSMASLVNANRSPDIREFLELLAEGQEVEQDLALLPAAAHIYQRAEQLDIDLSLKAFALSRSARVLMKSGDKTSAARLYQTLLKKYGDLRDESQVPYALSLAVSDEELPEGILTPGTLREIYEQLAEGRWELGVAQVEDYLARLERRLNLPSTKRPDTDFLDHLQLARALELRQSNIKPLDFNEVIPQVFQYRRKSYQTYLVRLHEPNNSEIMVGFSVSMPFISKSLLPRYSEDPDYRDFGSISLANVLETTGTETSSGNSYISLPTVLPFYRIKIVNEFTHPNMLAASRELWFVGVSSAMFMSVLAINLFLFLRVSWDIRWFQLRSDFVSGVSHEFKTPLSLIRLYSETLSDDDYGFSAEDRKNYIRIIARESERMSHLIDNVLNFSKMEKDHVTYALQEGDLTSVVSQAISDYSDYLTWRGFEIKSSMWPQLPPVKFNPEQVSQMLLNLMDNARKYSGKSRLIRVNLWVQGSEVVIEVQDNGLGISAEEIGKIFQPFYRVSKGDEKGGCGLGLYLVDQVMKAHGGRVEVESKLNRGSRFRLVFPVSGSRDLGSAGIKSNIISKAEPGPYIQDPS